VWLQVREFEPEVLILSPCSCNPSRSLSEVAPLAGLPGWWSLPAVKTGQVYIIDHNYFSRPGPRYVVAPSTLLVPENHDDSW